MVTRRDRGGRERKTLYLCICLFFPHTVDISHRLVLEQEWKLMQVRRLSHANVAARRTQKLLAVETGSNMASAESGE